MSTNLASTAYISIPAPCLTFTPRFTLHPQLKLRQLTTKRAPARIFCTPNATAHTRGPSASAPDYTPIDRNPLNALFTKIFLSKLSNELGYTPSFDKDQDTFSSVIVVIKRLAEKYRGRPSQLNKASQRVIASLFPSWLPTLFVHMFAKPVPYVAAWLNAVVTVAVTQWLMGPSSIIKEQDEDNDVFTVQIERCRYLEGTLIYICYALFPTGRSQL